MKTKRFITVGSSLTLVAILSGCGGNSEDSGNDYPQGQIDYIVPFSTGGSTDPLGREFSRLLAEELGTSATVHNHPGADEVIGITQVTDSEPDGMTIGLSSVYGAVAQPILHDDVDFEYTPIARMTETPYALLVSPDSEYETLDDFIEDAEERPGEVRIGLSSPYGGPSLTALNFEEQAGLDLSFVPFSGGSGDSNLAVMGGEIEATVANAAGQSGLVEAGDLVPLAHSGTPDYDDYLPGAISFEEAGYDIRMGADHMTIGPADMPDDVRETLQEAAANVLASDEWLEWAEESSNLPTNLVGEDLEAQLEEQVGQMEHSLSLAEAEQEDG